MTTEPSSTKAATISTSSDRDIAGIAQMIRQFFPTATTIQVGVGEASDRTGLGAVYAGDQVLWVAPGITTADEGGLIDHDTVEQVQKSQPDIDPRIIESVEDSLDDLRKPLGGPFYGQVMDTHGTYAALLDLTEAPASHAVAPQTAVLSAIADLGGQATAEQISEELGYTPTAENMDHLRAAGRIKTADEPGTDGFYRKTSHITYAGWRALARATNQAATFIPAVAQRVGPLEPGNDPDGGNSYPSLMVGGAKAYLFVGPEGFLCLSLHLDTGEVPPWLKREQEDGAPIPLKVTVGEYTVFSDTVGAPMAGPHRFWEHAQASGSVCPWSLEPAEPNQECPNECSEGGVERDPNGDTDN